MTINPRKKNETLKMVKKSIPTNKISNKNGRLARWFMEKIYRGNPPLLWECPEGHRWKATLESIIKKPVCPSCTHEH